MRLHTYKFLHMQGSELQQKLHGRGMIVLVLLSCIGMILTSDSAIAQQYRTLFFLLEATASLIFLLEFLLRLWSIPEQNPSCSEAVNRFRYIFSIMGFVDIASFLPFFLLLSGKYNASAMMLLQLMRLFKLTRYSPAFTLLGDVLKDEAESLLVSMMLMFIIFIIASVGIYSFEHTRQPEAFASIPHAMWWAIVTLTTVGYGDITPVTAAGKIFATLITIVGVGLVSLPAGIIASGFTEQLRLRRERFQSEVERLLHDDGGLSARDMEELDADRKELGIDKERADLIISQVQLRERRQKHD